MHVIVAAVLRSQIAVGIRKRRSQINVSPAIGLSDFLHLCIKHPDIVIVQPALALASQRIGMLIM